MSREKEIRGIRDWKYLPRGKKIFILVILVALGASLLLVNWSEIDWSKGEVKKSWMITFLGIDDATSLKIILSLSLIWIGIGTILVALKKISQQRLIMLSLVALVVIFAVVFVVKILGK